MNEFTKADAANLIRLARSAPLANMNQAEQAAALIKRFAQFVDDTIVSDDKGD